MVYPIIYRGSTIQGGAGFLPSTVGATIFWDCQALFSVLLWPKHVFFDDDAVSLLVNQHGDP